MGKRGYRLSVPGGTRRVSLRRIPESVSSRNNRFERKCRRVGVWLARVSVEQESGGDEMGKQDEKRCPCGHCEYNSSAHRPFWWWATWTEFDVPNDAGQEAELKYEKAEECYCPGRCGRHLYPDGGIGPSVEQLEAQRNVLARKLCWERCPNSWTYPTEWWGGCKYATRGDRERECGSEQTLDCWLRLAAEEAEVNNEQL